jgi:hypothetical protein
MRRFLLIACVAALAAGFSAATSSAAGSSETVNVTVCATDQGTPVSSVIDGAGGIHVRGAPIYNEMYAGWTDCSDTGEHVGSVDYALSYNLWPDGTTTAWCSFSMSTNDYGAFEGHCNGSLFTGHLVGHRSDGSTLEGTYQTDNPAAGYHLTITFNVR